MKKSHILGMLAAAASALPACSFLDRDPLIIPEDGYYNSEQKVLYGLSGVYGALNSEELYGNYYSLQISNADDLCYYNNYNNAETRVDKYNHSADTEVIYDTWAKLYEGIKNANRFMKAVEGSEHDPESRAYSEARFLRAYYHFLLAQAWGDVPMRTVSVSSPNPNDVQMAATAQEKVLEWCVDEIEACLGGLEPTTAGLPSRVNRAAAQGILARIYLFMAGESVRPVEGADKRELYRRAAYWANEVISSGSYSLNPDYPQVFINMISDRYDTRHYESMWEAEFLGDRTSAASWSNGRIGDLIGLKSQSPSNDYSEWACNYSYGYYNGTYRLWQLYFDRDRSPGERQDLSRPEEIEITDTRQTWNLPAYNYAGSNARKIKYTSNGIEHNEVLTIPASLHKTPWIYNNFLSLHRDELTGVDLSVDNPFNVANALYDPTLMSSVRNAGKWRRETVYEKQMDAKRLYTGINFPILRYSDILLMYAEAVNEYAGVPDAQARECVRLVRDRAGIATDPTLLNAGSDEFRTLVRNERARELAFEGLRKWDLIRWGIFVERMRSAGTEIPAENKYKNATILNYAAANYAGVSERHIYLPIPSKELAVNHALKQNPLW